LSPAAINANLSLRVVLDTSAMPWVSSPQSGVDRRMLDRIGDEVARATSLVRYTPGSTFPTHTHGLGEEFLVLDGVFSDEHGDYPAGTYVRNPPGSAHAPFTGPGCTIFVKLRQMPADERERIVVDTASRPWVPAGASGVDRLPLFSHAGGESVALERLAAGGDVPSVATQGEEIFVLEGSLQTGHTTLERGAWIRSPAGATNA
jgi:anti-sigma factor ChrR (cupin superfamily)